VHGKLRRYSSIGDDLKRPDPAAPALKPPTLPRCVGACSERTEKLGNMLSIVFLAVLAALFLYGYLPHFL
jgi:hypothetical protein